MDIAIGVDVAEVRKGLDVVALDGDRRIVEVVRKATAADVRRLTDELDPAVVCIDSPPAWATAGKSRTGERALRPLGISAYATPTDPGDHPFYRWMRAGFAVFDAVADRYPRYRGGDVRGTAAEVFPEATAVLLEGHLRPKDRPKAVFRRQVLEAHGVDHTGLRSVDAVDAALAALTGVLALAGEHSWVGDPAEGVILLPVRTLPSTRLNRPAPAIAFRETDAPSQPTSVSRNRRPAPAIAFRETDQPSQPTSVSRNRIALAGVCIDCGPAQFAATVRFYEMLLGRVATAGCVDPSACDHDGGDDHWASLPDPAGGATLNVQAEAWYEAPEWPERIGRQTKMLHLEIDVADVQAAVDVAVAAGGTVAEHQPTDRDPDRLRIVVDPAGHPLCLYRD